MDKRFCLGLICLLCLPSISSAAPQNSGVDIDINPATATKIGSGEHNATLSELRTVANQKAAKAASHANQSYVSMAPDPNNPNYWKEKNSEFSTNTDTSANTANNLMNEQDLQRQTDALQKLLAQLNKAQSRAGKIEVVAFHAAPHHTAHETNQKLVQPAFALPGTIWYATLLTAADSYVPGPVVARLQAGPLTGAKVLGQFKIAPDGEHLILTFHDMSYEGKSFAISAVAVDPNTKLSGVSGEINHHVLRRYIIPAAAGFLEEVTNALTNQEQSVIANASGIVVTSPKLSDTQLALMGASGATQSFAQAATPSGVMRLPEVKMHSGQGIGFLVLKPILST